MDKRVKIAIISGVTIVAVAIGAIAFLRPLSLDKTGEVNGEVPLTDQEYEELESTVYADIYQESLEGAYEKIANNENIDEYMDTHIQEIVHWMSNSTIRAKGDAKIGFIEPRPDNIEKLIEIVKHFNPTNGEFYEETLNEWLKGNFVNTKEIHNKAWNCLNGDIGKAIGPDQNRINMIKEKHFKE